MEKIRLYREMPTQISYVLPFERWEPLFFFCEETTKNLGKKKGFGGEKLNIINGHRV